MDLPRPKETLTLEAVGINPPGTNRIVVQGVAFQLKAGQGLGVIGPSASGKSSLVRAIVGVWPAIQGKIRIDGARHRPVDGRIARPAYRLPAAGHGAVRRHRRREHRALRARCLVGKGDRRGQGGQRP